MHGTPSVCPFVRLSVAYIVTNDSIAAITEPHCKVLMHETRAGSQEKPTSRRKFKVAEDVTNDMHQKLAVSLCHFEVRQRQYYRPVAI